jgi:hypothetical protein
VNNLGLELLTLLLLPKMMNTAKQFSVTPRVAFVTSDLFHTIQFPSDSISDTGVHEVLASMLIK